MVKANPSYEICRSQQDVEIQGDWKRLLAEARDSHWMMAYGDYLKRARLRRPQDRHPLGRPLGEGVKRNRKAPPSVFLDSGGRGSCRAALPAANCRQFRLGRSLALPCWRTFVP